MPVFWTAALLLSATLALRVDLRSPTATTLAVLLFVIGGLPHGAYDLHLAHRTARIGGRRLAWLGAAYFGTAIAMALLWRVSPPGALALFLVVAAVHFGADWTMLDDTLPRLAAGAAVIATPAIGQRADVTRLFVALAGEDGRTIAAVAVAVAPVALLVTAIGIVLAWRGGARAWALATAVTLALLLCAPALFGFALFFVFLHSPRHLRPVRAALGGMTIVRFLLVGGVMTAAALMAWLGWSWTWRAWPSDPVDLAASGFRLLSVVALPHLLLPVLIARLPLAGHESKVTAA